MAKQDQARPSRGVFAQGKFPNKVYRLMPWLFAAWLFLTVMSPHQDTYKVFFHAIAIPALLVLLYSRQSAINWRDPLLRTSLVLFGYAGVSTFLVGAGPLDGHIRAARWAAEITFGVLVFYVWLPRVVENPRFWGKLLLGLSVIGGCGGIIYFLLASGMEGRLVGFGALHNPIQAASVLLVYFALGQFLLSRTPASTGKGELLLLYFASFVTCLAVLLSESRAPIGALIMYFCFLGIIRLFQRPRLKELAGAFLVLGIPLLVIYWLYGGDQYAQQLLQRGMSYRLEIWTGYLSYPPESWWFGFGAGTPPSALAAAEAQWIPNDVPLTHAHNLFVGTLVETGIIGLGILLAMIVLLVLAVIRMRGSVEEKVRLLGILGLVLALSMTSTHTVVSSIKTVWLTVWLPVLFVWFWSLRQSQS